MPPLLVAGHLRQLPHTPAPVVEVIDVDAEQQAAPVNCLLLCTTRLRETRTNCRRRLSKPSMVSRCRPVFGGKGRVKPRLCTSLACTSKRSTRRWRPADNPKVTLPSFQQHIKTKVKHEKNISTIRINCNEIQLFVFFCPRFFFCFFYLPVDGEKYSSPHFHVFSYASCVDLTQLLSQRNASWRTLRIPL